MMVLDARLDHAEALVRLLGASILSGKEHDDLSGDDLRVSSL